MSTPPHSRIPLALTEGTTLVDPQTYSLWLQGKLPGPKPRVCYPAATADVHAADIYADEVRRFQIRKVAEAAGFEMTRSSFSGRLVYRRGDLTLSPVPDGWVINRNGITLVRRPTAAQAIADLLPC